MAMTPVPKSTEQSLAESTFFMPGFLKAKETRLRLFGDHFEIVEPNQAESYRYDEIDAFGYSSSSNYLNGTPQGVVHSLTLWRRGEQRDKSHQYTLRQNADVIKRGRLFGIKLPFNVPVGTVNPETDATLAELKEVLTGTIASRLIAIFSDGSEVPWTPGLTFVAAGLQIDAGRKGVLNCPYFDLGQLSADEGLLTIKTQSPQLPKIQIPMGGVNFYPGLRLLEGIFSALDQVGDVS